MTSPRFAVNHYLCPRDVPLDAFAAEVARAGFDGIGLTEAALSEMTLAELRRLLSWHGLAVSSVNTAGFFLSDDPQQTKRNEALLEAAAGLGAATLNVIVGAAPETVPLERARERAEEALASYARSALAAGVQLVVEPMWIANAFSKSCFQSLSQTRAIFGRIPGLKLNLDYYHLWADPDTGRALRGQDCPIGLLQICDVDWRVAPNEALRAPLGEGKLSVLAQLDAAGWRPGDYPVEVELFIDQLSGRDYGTLIRDAARQLKL